jgi:copper(I)-binding protein
MLRRRLLTIAAAAAGAVAGLLPAAGRTQAPPPPPAAQPPSPEVDATDAWTRAAGQGRNGAGYVTLRNRGTEPLKLVSGLTAMADRVELHTHIREGDVMRMRPVPEIVLPPGQEVRLEPSGLHLMFIGLRHPLRQGESVPVTLVFERGRTLRIDLQVLAAGARGPGPAMGGPSGGRHGMH